MAVSLTLHFRMTKENFDYILAKVKNRISHNPNHLRPIPPDLRLALTLRYWQLHNKIE